MINKPHFITGFSGIRFNANSLFVDEYGIDSDSIDYSMGCAHGYAYVHERNKNKKLYAQAYLRYLEGEDNQPDISKYNITSRQAFNVRRNMAGYAKCLSDKRISDKQ